MAAKKTVLGELGNVILEASKQVRTGSTKPKREEWLSVLEKTAAAYAAIDKSEPTTKKSS